MWHSKSPRDDVRNVDQISVASRVMPEALPRLVDFGSRCKTLETQVIDAQLALVLVIVELSDCRPEITLNIL